MLQVKDLTKIYQTSSGEIISLDSVSFDLESGEFAFITGESGAGKSTLVRLIIKQEDPTQGEIHFDNLFINQLPSKFVPLYRRNIGIVFQDYKLLNNKTVFENLTFVLEILNKSKEEIEESANYLLKLVGLDHRKDLFPNQLSGGEKRRLVLARAIANNPKMLIADEPTGDLDKRNTEEILQVLQKINDWGTTIIMVTHNLAIVNSLKKRNIILDKGSLIQDTGTKKAPSKSKKNLVKPKKEPPVKEEKGDLNKLQLEDKIVEKLHIAEINSIADLLKTNPQQLTKSAKLKKKEVKTLLNQLETHLKND